MALVSRGRGQGPTEFHVPVLPRRSRSLLGISPIVSVPVFGDLAQNAIELDRTNMPVEQNDDSGGDRLIATWVELTIRSACLGFSFTGRLFLFVRSPP